MRGNCVSSHIYLKNVNETKINNKDVDKAM